MAPCASEGVQYISAQHTTMQVFTLSVGMVLASISLLLRGRCLVRLKLSLTAHFPVD